MVGLNLFPSIIQRFHRQRRDVYSRWYDWASGQNLFDVSDSTRGGKRKRTASEELESVDAITAELKSFFEEKKTTEVIHEAFQMYTNSYLFFRLLDGTVPGRAGVSHWQQDGIEMETGRSSPDPFQTRTPPGTPQGTPPVVPRRTNFSKSRDPTRRARFYDVSNGANSESIATVDADHSATFDSEGEGDEGLMKSWEKITFNDQPNKQNRKPTSQIPRSSILKQPTDRSGGRNVDVNMTGPEGEPRPPLHTPWSTVEDRLNHVLLTHPITSLARYCFPRSSLFVTSHEPHASSSGARATGLSPVDHVCAFIMRVIFARAEAEFSNDSTSKMGSRQVSRREWTKAELWIAAGILYDMLSFFTEKWVREDFLVKGVDAGES